MIRNKKLVVALLALPLALAACSSSSSSGSGSSASAAASGGSGSGGSGGYGYKIAVVTHGSAGDAFWSVVKAGVEKAAAVEGDQVSYQSDGDPQKQAQLIDAAVAQGVQGLVVSMANPDALKASIQKAVAAGIPVITINSGADQSQAFGAIAHVGQDESVAGLQAGQKLKAAGVTHLICVIHEAGNVSLETRCKAAAQGLGAQTENLQVDNNNLTGAEATIKAKLQADPSINGILTLGGQMSGVAVKAVADAGSKALIGTFDMNSDVAKNVQDGKLLFAIDQQPYAQGYLPIVLIDLYRSNANIIGAAMPILTGPSFVTKDNVAAVAQLAAGGTR